MGGGHRTGQAPTRLVVVGMAASALLFALATTAMAAQGRRSAAAPLPALSRVPAPQPIPDGVVTPVTSRPSAPRTRTKAAPAVATTVPPTTTTAEAPPAPPAPPEAEIPRGKGMWVWKPDMSDGGNVAVMVARAKAAGLTHMYVRTGSTWDGFGGGPFLDQVLPAAHAAGIKVYGWDFPKLVDVRADVLRAIDAVTHIAPGGNRIDGFAADIETKTEGTELTPQAAVAYGPALRALVGPSYLLTAVVPNPTPQMLQKYPYELVVPSFDTIAPMVYWLNREPGGDVAGALKYLERFGKPMMPIGQAFDGGPEGGRPGVPPPAELLRFMNIAKDWGASAVSFWSWQHANPSAWDAIRQGPSFLLAADQPAAGG